MNSKIDPNELIEKLVLQRSYSRRSCLSDSKMVEYITGEVSEAERDEIDKHLENCTGCRQEIRVLREASEWFAQQQQRFFFELTEKSSEHLSDGLLFSLSYGLIPDTKPGRSMALRIEEHTRECLYCQKRLETYMRFAGELTRVSYEELEKSAARATIATKLISALAIVASRRALLRSRAPVGPITRAGEGDTVQALVLASDGKVATDDRGEAYMLEFGIIRASIEKDGQLIVDLSTSDKNYFETKDQVSIVEASIHPEATELILPSEKNNARGRVTISVPLRVDQELYEIPANSLRLFVRSEANVE